MDEISTGLDSSTTYQIVRSIGNVAHLREATVLMSLLQPPPETFDLFDDVMLLADGATGCLLTHLPLYTGQHGMHHMSKSRVGNRVQRTHAICFG